MKKIYSIIIAIFILLPGISMSDEDDCKSYLELLNNHDFITYTTEGNKINFLLRFRNGTSKEVTGFCKTHPRLPSYKLSEYYSEYDIALFRVKKDYKNDPKSFFYVLMEIKNGNEHDKTA